MGNTEGIMNTELNLSSLYSAKYRTLQALDKSVIFNDADLEAGARNHLTSNAQKTRDKRSTYS